ncbi:AAA family ATPase [Actinomycetospora sp. OC33-EN08]|uniref:AAA family ATPase n=1 Tax=Actinomycetospora aurantiaca TaxID=3129233 RepID=A0ABU8MV24_9PSEU
MELIGRDEARSTCRTVIADLTRGRGGVLVVEGVAGSGRTALLDAVAEEATAAVTRATAGADVEILHATGLAGDREVPLGVVHQLLRSRPATWGRTDESTRAAIELASFRAMIAGPGGGFDAGPHLVGDLCTQLLGPDGGPVLLVVDDAQHADELSLRCLHHLARRARHLPVVLVVGVENHPDVTWAPFRAELVRHRHSRRVLLGRIDADGVATVLGDHAAGGPLTAVEAEALTGGSPALLAGLVEDLETARALGDADVPGCGYRRAVLSVLHRAGPGLLELARAAAVLGDETTPSRVAALLDRPRTPVPDLWTTLERMGLVAGQRLRHPLVADTVLSDVDAGELRALHRAAAEHLAACGAPARVVARHLLAVDEPVDDEGLGVLCEAIESVLRASDVQGALGHVDLAARSVRHDAGRATVTSLAARVQDQASPVAARSTLRRLVPFALDGALRPADAADIVPTLLGAGLADEAVAVLDHLAGRVADDGADTELAHELAAVLEAVAVTHPGVAERLAVRAVPTHPGTAPSGIRAWARHQGADVLRRVHTHGPDPASTRDAERAVASAWAGSGPEAVELALTALVHADELETADRLATELLEPPIDSGRTQWRAHLLAIRAQVRLRRGDPTAARDDVRRATETLGVRGWGTARGLPVAVGLQADLALRRRDDAAARLDTPLLPGTADSRHELHVLHARALLHRAGQRPRAAAADLERCGRLAARWGCDLPAVVPWRTELAEVALALDDAERARELLEAQVALPGGDRPRLLGPALRVLAACGDASRRGALLRESVTLLQGCGHRVELRRSLLALARFHRRSGEDELAASILARAETLAAEIGIGRAAPVVERIVPSTVAAPPARAVASAPTTPTAPRRAERPTPAPPTGPLTSAESRVADLAARGHSNRAIAARLFVTVSTVEQHLTRIYKKLGVSRREDLPLDRPADVG